MVDLEAKHVSECSSTKGFLFEEWHYPPAAIHRVITALHHWRRKLMHSTYEHVGQLPRKGAISCSKLWPVGGFQLTRIYISLVSAVTLDRRHIVIVSLKESYNKDRIAAMN